MTTETPKPSDRALNNFLNKIEAYETHCYNDSIQLDQYSTLYQSYLEEVDEP